MAQLGRARVAGTWSRALWPSRPGDAVQRFPGDANGSRECAPDDRLRIVRCDAPQSRDPHRRETV
jgi:hypothetical protein